MAKLNLTSNVATVFNASANAITTTVVAGGNALATSLSALNGLAVAAEATSLRYMRDVLTEDGTKSIEEAQQELQLLRAVANS